MNYITEQIKNLVPLSEAIEGYTGERFLRNKMRCPLHNEKTASFTVYPNNTFYCFGCGASGDIIKFVQLYFGIGFKEAIVRLDYDYNLGLLNRPSLSEYRKQQRRAAELKAERQRERAAEQERSNNYWQAFDLLRYYERILKEKRPSSSDETPSPEFIKALQNIEYARHLFECAENERNVLNK